MDEVELVVSAFVAIPGVHESDLVHLLHCQGQEERDEGGLDFQRVFHILFQIWLQYFGHKVYGG